MRSFSAARELVEDRTQAQGSEGGIVLNRRAVSKEITPLFCRSRGVSLRYWAVGVFEEFGQSQAAREMF